MKTCSVIGCDKPFSAKGFCSSHYERWRRHGRSDGGRTGRGEVADYIKSLVGHEGKECLIWPYAKDQCGYPVSRGGVRVNRLICAERNGPPPSGKHQAAHSCGNGHLGCVNPAHLRWATPKENASDKWAHGTQVCGEAFGGAKLCADDVLAIRADERPRQKIAEAYGVSRNTIRYIQSRKTWRWL